VAGKLAWRVREGAAWEKDQKWHLVRQPTSTQESSGQQGYPGGPGYPGPGYGGPGGFQGPSDPYGLGKLSAWPTFLVTFFGTLVFPPLFGFLGLIPVIRHAGMARQRGYSQVPYWLAFGLTIGLLTIISIVVYFAILAAITTSTVNSIPSGS
jgi:hypothetical protein